VPGEEGGFISFADLFISNMFTMLPVESEVNTRELQLDVLPPLSFPSHPSAVHPPPLPTTNDKSEREEGGGRGTCSASPQFPGSLP